MTKVSQIICDKCGHAIGAQNILYVDASVYGIDLHIHCFNELSALEILHMLNIDDITIEYVNVPDKSEKLISRRKGMKTL